MGDRNVLRSNNESSSCSTDVSDSTVAFSDVQRNGVKAELETDSLPPTLVPEAPQPDVPNMENGNAIMICADDLLEVGIGMENLDALSEEQISLLMQAAERREGREQTHPVDGVMEQEREQHYGQRTLGSDALTIVITDDGSLKLTDTGNQTFFFSNTQLAEMNIDVNNLSDESVQQIVQMAMPVINVGKNDSKRQDVLFDHGMDMVEPSTSNSGKQEIIGASQLIGEQVEVKREGKAMLATIRYVRSGGGCKVQFDDGHFEWITDEQMVVRSNRRTDHEGYHNESNSRMQNLKRLANEPLHTPGKRSSTNEPNFCCPICENKVHQVEPAYIVIRIPACDSCTRQKIVVLEDNVEEETG